MPMHPRFAGKLHLLEGISSFEQALADPDMASRLAEFGSAGDGAPPPEVEITMASVPGPHGQVPVRIHTPLGMSDALRPAIVWVHGGGFSMGSIDAPDQVVLARELCARASAVVISVEYRLAVDGVCFPVPHDDVVASIRWARQEAQSLRVNPALISIGGDSAGGNIAAGAALRLRDEDSWTAALLLLVYPTLHPILPPLSSELAAKVAELPDLLRFLPAVVANMNRNYLGGPENTANGYAMPGIGALRGLCPTVIVNAEYDDLRASGEAFTASLAVAGVNVRQVTALGLGHAFLSLPNTLEPVERVLDLLAREIADTDHRRN